MAYKPRFFDSSDERLVMLAGVYPIATNETWTGKRGRQYKTLGIRAKHAAKELQVIDYLRQNPNVTAAMVARNMRLGFSLASAILARSEKIVITGRWEGLANRPATYAVVEGEEVQL